MAEIEYKKKIDEMMSLAEFGARRNEERRSLVFRIFISYLTFLVLTASVVFANKFSLTMWENFGIVVVLIAMLFVYNEWLRVAYAALIYEVRRRDFFMKKAEVLCYYSSEELDSKFSDSEKVSINLGSGKRYEASEKYLFKKRAPDIENSLPPTSLGIAQGYPLKFGIFGVCGGDWYFRFNLWFPALLTILIVVVLFCRGVQQWMDKC